MTTCYVDQDTLIEELRQSEARNQALLRAIPDLMFLFSFDGIYLEIKADSQSELVAATDQLRNRCVTDILPPELAATVLHAIRQTLETQAVQQFEYQIMLADGLQTFEARTAAVNDHQVMMLARDITSRVRAEQERLALQEQIIAQQEAILRELGTPIVPISDGVVAMPLIGSINNTRAQQVIETLLQGVINGHATIAILDITGVPVVDTYVANTLIRAAQAVQLLGARMILTGIKPEVAQTLVGLGVDLSGFLTLATLQNGIAYALRRR